MFIILKVRGRIRGIWGNKLGGGSGNMVNE